MESRSDAPASPQERGTPHEPRSTVCGMVLASLIIRIAGLSNVDKPTLFDILIRATVLAANYPFIAIELNAGVMSLLDPCLETLAEMFYLEKVISMTVSFVDIAGIMRSASGDGGLGNRFLANICEADATCQVMRVFSDPDVMYVDGRVNPASDIGTI